MHKFSSEHKEIVAIYKVLHTFSRVLYIAKESVQDQSLSLLLYQAMGKLGVVKVIDTDGDVAVKVGGASFVFHPACLIPSPTEMIPRHQPKSHGEFYRYCTVLVIVKLTENPFRCGSCKLIFCQYFIVFCDI